MRMLSNAAVDAGATGVMVAPPPRLRTDEESISYYKGTSKVL